MTQTIAEPLVETMTVLCVIVKTMQDCRQTFYQISQCALPCMIEREDTTFPASRAQQIQEVGITFKQVKLRDVCFNQGSGANTNYPAVNFD